MSTPFAFDLRIRAEENRAVIRRRLSATIPGLLAVSMLLLAIPVAASGSERGTPPNTDTTIADCATLPDSLIRSHREMRLDDPVNGAWTRAQAEFLLAEYGADSLARTAQCDAMARFHRANPIDDPANGAWSLGEAKFYLDAYSEDQADCTTWSEAIARFHRAKPVSDPANGAWSRGEAEFYVAKYGGDGALLAGPNVAVSAVSCDAEPNAEGPES